MSDPAISESESETAQRGTASVPAQENADGHAATASGAESVEAAASSGIAALALRRIRPLSPDWAAVSAAAALAIAVSLGWKVTW